MASSSPSTSVSLPAALINDIRQAGYYPALVADVVASAVAGEEITAHLVHQETTLDQESVRRHITVLALTPARLVIAHADDHAPDPSSGVQASSVATASTETVPLSAVRGVMLTHVVPSPDKYRPGSLGRELTLTLGWGTVSRIDLIPATCGDPQCEADHGFEGTVTGDDIALRISADAEGEDVLAQAHAFAATMSVAIGRA
ncbi:DUF5998 family protein [Luteipulveratus mongoliensis]|uniref:Phosphodiesterase n=1 Tax=Luteipulveratus mongoliensis TaxID=571913 RepID=A0A0K1JR28_9MICO|nr:DUF5998 family protein [Luteipulveratus mongoliensis]AKU19005.1 phosphodiesterase [Luteipulveratus mongoliensis]